MKLLLLLLSHFNCVQICATPETAARQAPPSLGFSRQEHWSGLPFPSPMHESEKWKGSCSVVSNSSQPHGPQPTRLLCPWDFLGKSTGVGCHCLLQEVQLAFIHSKERAGWITYTDSSAFQLTNANEKPKSKTAHWYSPIGHPPYTLGRWRIE